MKILKYIESFIKIQLILTFIILCIFLTCKKKYIEGFLGFSDYSENDRPEPGVNHIDTRIKDEINMGYSDYTWAFDKKIVDDEMTGLILNKKNLEHCPEAPGFNCSRIGFFCSS